MNPIISSVAGSCSHLVPSSSSPRGSPWHSPIGGSKFPHMLGPPSPNPQRNTQARRSSEDYRKQLAANTREAFKSGKATKSAEKTAAAKENVAREKNKKLLLDAAKEHKAAIEQEKSRNEKSAKANGSKKKKDTKCVSM